MPDVCLKIVLGGRCNPIYNSSANSAVLVIDSLLSSSKEYALSANQGRVLYELISNFNSWFKKYADGTIYTDDSLRINKDLIVNGIAQLLQGFEIGNFTQGAAGSGAALKMVDGISELEVDKLTVRMVATFFELIISKLSHIGGQVVLSPARMKVRKVEDGGTYYRCYFEAGENGEAVNEFVTGDQARCQVFSGTGAKMYWRLVTSVGTDWINLSKTDQVGDGIPEVGDEIVQLGNRTDVTRQSAQILSTVGSDAPSYKQYGGINSFSLEGKELTVFSSKGNTIYGRTKFRSSKGTYEDMGEWADTTDQKIDDTKTELEKKIPAIWKVIPVNTNPGAPFYVDEKAKDERMRSISLTVRYTRNGEDVSIIMAKSTQRLYTWGRTNPLGVDDNGVTDEDWTLSNANRDIVTLTPDDIMWVANIYTEFDPVILEQQYNLLK